MVEIALRVAHRATVRMQSLRSWMSATLPVLMVGAESIKPQKPQER